MPSKKIKTVDTGLASFVESAKPSRKSAKVKNPVELKISAIDAEVDQALVQDDSILTPEVKEPLVPTDTEDDTLEDGEFETFSLGEEDSFEAHESEEDAAAEQEKISLPKRSEFEPPVDASNSMTLAEYLEKCTPRLDYKIIDIALREGRVAIQCRAEAAQEIRVSWLLAHPNVQLYKPQQIAAYAYKIAGTTALRIRREMEGAVRLPGSAFRKKRDGTTYVSAGHIAAPLDWSDADKWMDVATLSDAMSSRQLRPEEVIEAMSPNTCPELLKDLGLTRIPETETELLYVMMASKLGDCLQRLKNRPSPMTNNERIAVDILTSLVRGETLEKISERLSLSRSAINRKLDCLIPLIH